MSNHIRIRSISFRSIRGLYFRKGCCAWRVERVGYVWSSVEGSRRFALKLDRLSLEIGMTKPEKTLPPPRRHIRNLTLADLNPSPLARRLWSLISTVTSFLEPFFRPLIRTYVVACLRIGIQLLPMLSQALSFDLQSVVVTFTAVPGAEIVAEQISLHTSVDFTQLEPVLDLADMEVSPRIRDTQKANGMSIWKRRLTESFHRSLDRAWGMTKGTATIALKVHNVAGTSPSSFPNNGIMVPFLLSTGVIDLSMMLQFNPKAGTIEPHSLGVKLATGHCSAKVDTLNTLMKKLRPEPARGVPVSTLPTSGYPSSPYVDSPLTSSFPFSSSQPSSNFSSALPTFSTSNFSPIPTSPTQRPTSPRSPFLRALSAKMRPRPRYYTQPCSRLKNAKDASLLSILKRVDVSVASIALSVLPDIATGPYKAVIQDAQLTIDQSDHNQHDLHRQFLGRNTTCESFDAESYAIRFLVRETTIERHTKQDSFCFLKLGAMELNALACQWPSPWLVISPFIRGDPNAALLAVQVKVKGIELVEQLDHLRQLIDNIEDVQLKTQSTPPPFLAPLMIPRISFAMECGSSFGRIIYEVSGSSSCNAVEMRTRGFTASIRSGYAHSTLPITRQIFPETSDVPVRLECNVHFGLEPTFIRARSNWDSDSKAEHYSFHDNFLDDPPMLSIGMVELLGTIHGFAEMDVVSGVAMVDQASLISDLHLSIETICVELWHQAVVDSIHHLLSVLPAKAPSPITTSRTEFNRLPVGLAAKVAVSRLVFFVTAPDINPGDKSELSRGLALRAGVGVEYCSLHASHDHWFEDHRRTQTRTQLSLPAESTVDAITAVRASGPSQDVSAFIKIRASDLVLKSVVATQFEPDEPAIFGRDDIPKSPHEFLCIGTVQTDVCLSYKKNPPPSQATNTCNVSIHIPYIRANFQLVHVYSVLLALQTLRCLSPSRPPCRSNEISLNSPHHKVLFMVQMNITAVQVLWALPQQTVVTRIDGLAAHLASNGPPRLRMHKAVALVPLPSQANRWEEISTTRKWGELIGLHAWEICFSPHAGSLSAAVEGESLRLRIPPGFVLADLIYNSTVTVKALRHIAHMANAGCYSDVPPPEPEGPKMVPHLTFRLNYLCLEALDDPFESKLSLIWQAGAEAVKQRVDREEAFLAKVAAIQAAEPGVSSEPVASKIEHDYQFGAKHSISVQEARKRLDDVHALDWTLRLERLRERRSKEEDSVLHKVYGTYPSLSSTPIPDLVSAEPLVAAPPLLRAAFYNLSLTVSPPSFSTERLADFLYDQGNGVPRNTPFSLLVPMHIHFTLSSLQITLRDHPLPLLNIPPHSDTGTVAWTFDTDLVVGEELGTPTSVEWVACPIIEQDHAFHGEAPLSITVPKTIMPVKTYANPIVKVNTSATTALSWGVSYGPAIQDVMRIVETLTTPQRDSSPPIGFWDKMRLVFHWSIKVAFAGDVQLYLKGSRDPHSTTDEGAGFVLSWQGNPEIHIAYPNEQQELVQVTSDVMLIAVPDLEHLSPSVLTSQHHRAWEHTKPFQKVCAQLCSGVRYGIGFVPERACGPECTKCRGTPFHRKCRHFTFRPHFEVKLEKKIGTPTEKGPEDSYNGFRSDFVHLSVSLASSIKFSHSESSSSKDLSSLHLTPKIFAHFWSWWALFDGVLSLPVRQGTYHPTRMISPKLSRHIATIKYRISVPRLYFMHGYMDNSQETWVDGVTTWVGVKGLVDEIQADMHQREEESIVAGPVPNTIKVLRRKPFYAAQVLMKGLDLRTLLATFADPLKQDVLMAAPPQRSNYRKHTELPLTPSGSLWYDLKDFIELDWHIPTAPALHLLPLATCPRFTYFKRNSGYINDSEPSKFGSEKSHSCLLGKEPSVPQTQISLALIRAEELKQAVETERNLQGKGRKGLLNVAAAEKMIILLEKYAKALQESESGSSDPSAQSYCMASEIVSPAEWAEFENVYQIHCPSILMDNAIRDIMMQYYYCSRARRGIEYHMSTRAVKFIRDQANAALAVEREAVNKDRVTISAAQVAASALLKILKGDSTKSSVDLMREKNDVHPNQPNPLDGWAEGVSLRKSHCCLLLKPQIVLQGEGTKDACIVAAAQAKLQSFAIMDVSNLDDPVSGKVMSRNYTTLSGLQAFSPTYAELGNASVPLEVLIDLRCESNRFERIVPQTDATFHYDKFNRLRLRNQVTSITTRVSTESTATVNNHLQAQTDLIRVHIPRFTVSANEEHFQAISNILTKVLLFSDAAHKTRLEKLETLIFTYDFTDLVTAANVVTSLQCRLRDALETDRMTVRNPRRLDGNETKLGLLKLRAHIFHLAEELNLLFDAIKLAQDRFNDQSEQNSALLLHTSSSEISWKMLDERRNLLSKLVVQNIDFHWLSRQDSSTVNHLAVGNLTAFDGSRCAIWAEILSKHDEPANHPLLKRGLFLLADWTVLAPVGGITIYESFELSFHPLRLQIDAKVGRRIMEYLWPDRKQRLTDVEDAESQSTFPQVQVAKSPVSPVPSRSSLDSPRALHNFRNHDDLDGSRLVPPLRRLGTSRSFTDLRSTRDHTFLLQSDQSSDSINVPRVPLLLDPPLLMASIESDADLATRKAGDAAEMKTRSSQKSFVLVRVSSLNLLLSIVKEGSFECHDARIRTRDLEYRNQTWSFEELVNQFIPSNMSWRGWVKMAFHQPLLPVLPVAKELISKTKWTKGGSQPHENSQRLLHTNDDPRLGWMQIQETKRTLPLVPNRGWRNAMRSKIDLVPVITPVLTEEPEALPKTERSTGRKRVLSLFKRGTKSGSKDGEDG